MYGFWGLLLISNLQAAPARWLVTHASFVPIFRSVSPTQFVKSIFACGLICAVTIIPIITSISREVMAQAPRDVCEAALGLGGTRWGMVTDVILPFSRNGILGAVLLGIGRGLGETMIVYLVLSQGNHLTIALMGPGGLGFDRRRNHGQLRHRLAHFAERIDPPRPDPFRDDPGHQHRGKAGRPALERERAVTQTLEPPVVTEQLVGLPPDLPQRKRSVPLSTVIELAGSAVSAFALVWLVFSVAGIAGPLGFGVLRDRCLLGHLRFRLLGSSTAYWP